MIFDHFAAAMFAAKIPVRGCQVSHFSDHNSKGSWPTPTIRWPIIALG